MAIKAVYDAAGTGLRSMNPPATCRAGGHRLKRDRGKQANREQEVNEEQDFPERVLTHNAEYYVHRVSSALLALAAKLV